MKRIEKMVMTICCVALLFITTGSIAFERSAAKDLIIIFTHDLHSYFLPHRVLTEQGNQIQ
jgi:2',3'-cyclic-nucleotide 2'-phosphodiesterase (5'-nucleotidase family)